MAINCAECTSCLCALIIYIFIFSFLCTEREKKYITCVRTQVCVCRVEGLVKKNLYIVFVNIYIYIFLI